MDRPTFANDLSPMPAHIAIIMDGNGRWAKAQGMPRAAGHQYGASAVRRTIEAAAALGVSYLTLFGFSAENWKRPSTEVDDLMHLMRRYLKSELAELHANGIRIRVIGERERLPADVIDLIQHAEKMTEDNTKLTLIVAVSYGGRQEIAAAAKVLARKALSGEISLEDIDATSLEAHLWTGGISEPDLVIRTSGEQRISNFMLWQLAYSEFVFLDMLWPDFDRAALEAAIQEYQGRDRRYGDVAEMA